METTAHGVGNVVKDDRGTWVRVLWLIVVLTVVAGVFAHLSFVFVQYSEYKTHETTEILEETPEFPHVTICNLQAISQNHTVQYEVINNVTELTRYYELLGRILNDILDYNEQLGGNVEDFLLSPEGIFANINSTTAQALGHSLKDFILNCTYMSTGCDMETDWSKVLNSQYFNCYTFTNDQIGDSAATGPNNGLSVILYLENVMELLNEYTNFFNQYSNTENAYGARLVVHEAGTLPLPKDFGIDIIPGHSTSVGIRPTKVKLLQKPWGDCTNQKKLTKLERYRYDAHNCLSTCKAHAIERKCGCIDYANSIPDDMALDTPFCRFVDNDTVTFDQFVSNMECAYYANLVFVTEKNKRELCGCREPCVYHTYDLTVSQSIWPASRYHLNAFDKLVLGRHDRDELLAYHQINQVFQDYIEEGTDDRHFTKLMYENFARINVYFETQNLIQRKQIQSMTLASLFSNVGGTLGLWAGLSVVTIVELISLIVSLIGILTSKCRKRKEKMKIDSEMKEG